MIRSRTHQPTRLVTDQLEGDFAVRHYRAGPVLELAGNSPSLTARLRAAGLAPLRELVRASGETANLSIRTGDRVRFVASVECDALLRVSSREGTTAQCSPTSSGASSRDGMRRATSPHSVAARSTASPADGVQDAASAKPRPPDLCRQVHYSRHVTAFQCGVGAGRTEAIVGVISVSEGRRRGGAARLRCCSSGPRPVRGLAVHGLAGRAGRTRRGRRSRLLRVGRVAGGLLGMGRRRW